MHYICCLSYLTDLCFEFSIVFKQVGNIVVYHKIEYKN